MLHPDDLPALSSPPMGNELSEQPSGDLRFLVIDDNPDGRFLVSKTLLRKFPNALLVECQSAQTALTALRSGDVSGVILHRTFDSDGASLVRELRKIHPTLPIVMMSGIDRTEVARDAGASHFLLYDEWLLIGNVIADLLRRPTDSASPLPPMASASGS